MAHLLRVCLSPPCLWQQDQSGHRASLPPCPQASPQSHLLDAPLLSGSESADQGLAGCVKDYPRGSEPWAPPSSSTYGCAQERPRSSSSSEQVMIQTCRATQTETLFASSLPRMQSSSTASSVCTVLLRYMPIDLRVWKGLGIKRGEFKVRLLI